MVRLGISGRLVRQLSFDDLSNVEVEEGSDDEGGLVWRPALRLRSGELVYCRSCGVTTRAGVKAGMAVVAEACGLPSRPPSGAVARVNGHGHR